MNEFYTLGAQQRPWRLINICHVMLTMTDLQRRFSCNASNLQHEQTLDLSSPGVLHLHDLKTMTKGWKMQDV